MTELLFKGEVFAIIGAAIEVHRELGPGFLEAVYQEAMELEERQCGIPFESNKRLKIAYKGAWLEKHYEADQVCYEKIIVEFKALDRLTGREESQVLNYLKASKLRLGLLINFSSAGKLEWKRLIY